MPFAIGLYTNATVLKSQAFQRTVTELGIKFCGEFHSLLTEKFRRKSGRNLALQDRLSFRCRLFRRDAAFAC